MPGTKLTEDVVKDVTEGLLEEIKCRLNNDSHYQFFFDEVQEASYDLWAKYKGRPYTKIRLCRYHGDTNPPLLEQEEANHNKRWDRPGAACCNDLVSCGDCGDCSCCKA